ASIFTRSRTNSRPPSLIVGMAQAKQSLATTENICCSAQRAISSRPSATRNLQMCIATCSAFIWLHCQKKRRIPSGRRAMKAARQRKNDKRKKQRKPKRKSRRKKLPGKNRKKNQRSPS